MKPLNDSRQPLKSVYSFMVIVLTVELGIVSSILYGMYKIITVFL